MKFHNAMVAAIVILFTSGAASAAVVDYGNPTTGGGENIGNIGLVPAGQSGTFFTSPNAGLGLESGSLANNTIIKFNYEFSSSSPVDILGSSGGTSGTPDYAAATSNGFSLSTGGVFATANVSGVNGSTSITNVSGGNINFSSFFVGLMHLFSNGVGGFVGKINYSVSAVPIPASALLFGSAIAGMFGFSYLSRKRRDNIQQA